MKMNKIAYSVFIAFIASLLTLVSVSALSSCEHNAGVHEGLKPITLTELAEHDGAESCLRRT